MGVRRAAETVCAATWPYASTAASHNSLLIPRIVIQDSSCWRCALQDWVFAIGASSFIFSLWCSQNFHFWNCYCSRRSPLTLPHQRSPVYHAANMDYEALKDQWSDVEDRDGIRLSWNTFPSSRMVGIMVSINYTRQSLTQSIIGSIPTCCPHWCRLHTP